MNNEEEDTMKRKEKKEMQKLNGYYAKRIGETL